MQCRLMTVSGDSVTESGPPVTGWNVGELRTVTAAGDN